MLTLGILLLITSANTVQAEIELGHVVRLIRHVILARLLDDQEIDDENLVGNITLVLLIQIHQ